ncbi:MAG: hypothetical protein JST54_19025 [Deltaproteobacteria bacterium]|nr:hypothetical protein [Deltaproteobacteria bacterium]
MTVAGAITTALAPLDTARRATLAVLGAPARRLIVDRELRVLVVGLSSVAAAFVGAVWFPMWMLALGPIVLGVPHLLSDVRYLIARPLLYRRRELVAAVGLPLLATALRPEAWVGLLAAVGAVACARGSLVRRAAILAPVTLAYAGAYRFPMLANLVVLHAHNAVALVLWWIWRPRRFAAHGPIAAAIIAGAAVLLLGVFSPALAGPNTATPLIRWLGELAPGASLTLAVRWLMCFAFAQSVHYALWLRLVPDDDRVRRTPRSFRATFDALRADLGMPILAITVALALGLALWGAWDLAAARYGYLRFSAFHAYLEVAALALCVAEARSPGEALA